MNALPGPDGRHLNGVDLELLLAGNEEDHEFRQLTLHLHECLDCQKLMDRYHKESQRFNLLKSSENRVPRGDCPAREVWTNMAAGTLDEPTADRLLNHAASCGHCGARLKEAMEDLHSEDLPNEAALALSSQFRDDVIGKLAPAPRVIAMPSRRWIAAAVAAAAAVVVSSGIWYWKSQPDAAQLIAQSYAEHRTMELRIPGAAHSPLRVLKGQGGAAVEDERSAEAELLIRRALNSEPASPRWLQLRSRLDLLNWRYDRAISTLEKLSAGDSSNLSLHTDLGNAYLLRGTHLNEAGDLHKAVDTLGRVIGPGGADGSSELFRASLFNHALAQERLYLWDGAAADWKRYLQIDSASGWAREAQTRLQQIEEKKRVWLDRLKQQQLPPAGFLAALQRPADVPLEPYLELAVTEWIPALAAGSLLPGTEPALAKLAELAAARHHDRWLMDLLGGLGHPQFKANLEMLAAAMRANAAGRRDQGGELAGRAAQGFAAAGNTAGLLRARVERVYSLSRAFRSPACGAEASDLAQPLLDRGYTWAHGQLLLERSTCAVRTGQLGQARLLLDEAVDRIKAAGYEALLLRCLGFSANLQMVLGRYADAARLNLEGLALFWKGVYRPLRGYQFYDNVSQTAEREERWELGFAAESEALPLIDLAGLPGTAGVARYRLAMFAGKTGRTALAGAEIARAEEDFGKIKTESSAPTLRAESQLLVASSLLESGQLELSRRVLGRVRLADLQDSILFRMSYHRAQGTAAVREDNFEAGRRELWAALTLAGRAIPDLRNERDRAHWKREAGPVYRELVRLALDRDRDPDFALAIWEAFRSAPVQGSLASPSGVGGVTATGIRQLAAGYRNASVLTYAEIGDSLHGWFYDSRGIHSFRSPAPAADLALRCGALHRLVAQPDSSAAEIHEQSRRLYDALIAPVEPFLESGKLLLIEPDGPCSAIPFEILRDASNVYLTDRFALATSPGAWAERALRVRSQPLLKAAHALVVENPRLAAGLISLYPPLPNSRREAGLVTAAFSSHARLAGPNATHEAVIRELPRAGIFYFGGHGASYSDNGGILLAPRPGDTAGAALLDGEALEPVLRRCRLAILSACSTAAGERMGPFNPASLIQAFWRGGVPSVVATRWEVDERATTALIDSLLRQLLSGVAPPAALRAAMSEVRHLPGLEHPAHWAAFHVFGTSQAEPGERGI